MKGDNITGKAGQSKKILLFIVAAVVVIAVILGALWGMKSSNTGSTEPPKDIEEVTASDEASLRELLLQENELSITVSGDIEINKQFLVKGTKVLKGDGTLRMSLDAEWGQSLLVVKEGATLFMDGLVLDGNYIADGIHMEDNAFLTYLSGTIRCTDVYGIWAKGNVIIKDVNIEKAEYIAIFAAKDSKVSIEGGTLKDTATNDVYVYADATVDISGETVFDGCMGDSMLNYGTLNVSDGTFKNANSYTFNNYGVLNIAYAGEDKDGYVEASGSRLGIVCTRKDAETNISKLHVYDTTRQAVVTVGGKTNILDSKFERTGYHAIEIQAGEAMVKNVTVAESLNSGLENYTNGVVTIEDFTVTGCEGIGIANRGGKLTGSNISIANTKKYGISCGDSANGEGTVVVSNVVITGTEKSSVYSYTGGEIELSDIKIADGTGRGIYVAETASCVLSGNSSISNMKYRGVEVRGEFVLNKGEIFNNHVENSGAGVYVSEEGNFTMNGGAIYNNSSALRGGGICVTVGKVTINGGEVYGNSAKDNGGGLYAQKEAVVVLKGGSIKNNKSDVYGNGIYVASKATQVTMSGEFYLGGNDVKLGNVESVLHITGNGLKKHSAKDPLLLTPSHSAKEGSTVADCENETIAQSMMVMVKSGDGSYNIMQNAKNLTVAFASADMDMTGADTVYVSSFAELKEAVNSTTSKRYIVLKADVVFSERLRLPGGVTICIKDDGNKRTLTRAEGFADNFIVTHYGTGLYLEATKAGNLVVDGTHSASVEGNKVQPLLRVAGSTEIRNVILQNNGAVAEGNAVRGALLRQLHGDFAIYNSVFTGGLCESGGAIMMDAGIGRIEGSTFSKNQSVIGGGAIRVGADTQLVIADSVFTDNHAGSTGGAFVAVGGSKVTVSDTKFTNNTAVSYGGAVSAQDEGTSVVLLATEAKTAIFEKNSTKTAGAICVQTKAQLSVSGYTFTNNRATDGRAGAVAVNSGASAAFENAGFYQNTATGSGGALATDAGTIEAVSCQFGKENAGNTAGDKGGAILVTGNGVVNMSVSKDGKYNSLSNNTAIIGGAICVYNGEVTMNGYSIKDNSANNGGAVYVEKGAKLNTTECTFDTNKAQKKGGAVYNAGTYADKDTTFTANESEVGAAVALIEEATATLSGTKGMFVANTTTAPGAAIYVSRDAVCEVSGYVFKDNVASSGGAIYIFTGGKLSTENVVFESNIAKKEAENGVEYGNGGAVQVLGTYVDKNSSFVGNTGKNGGALIVMTDGKATLTGDSTEATFAQNEATVNGGAVYVNIGGTLNVTGYGFDKNHAVLGGAVYTVKDTTVSIADAVMTENTASRGAAIYSNSTMSVTGSAFEKNVAQNEGGALYAVAGSDVTVEQSAFTQNEAPTGGGAIYVAADAIVTSEKSVFTENTAGTGGNGGAVHTKGTYNDIRGTYVDNSAKNGGAIAILKDSNATNAGIANFINETTQYTLQHQGAFFSGNKATGTNNSRGAAIFVNSGASSVSVSGYTFEDNSVGLGEVYVVSGGSAAIADTTFTEKETAIVYVAGTLTFENITEVTLKQENNGTLLVAGYEEENDIAIIPGSYTGNRVVLEKADGVADDVFVAACDNIVLEQENTGDSAGEDDQWYISSEGTLQRGVASIGDVKYGSLAEAVDYANTIGGTGEAEDIVIILFNDETLTEKIAINKNIKIINKEGKNVTILRDVNLADDMFVINDGAKLTLGTSDENEEGKLIVDGTSESRIAYRSIENKSGAIFVLEKNASLENANSSLKGAALYNSGTAYVYGTILSNATTNNGSGIYAVSGAQTTMQNAIFAENYAKGGGAAIFIEAGATVTGTNCIFDANEGSTTDGNGGAVHVKGTYTDTNSTYTNNTGKNGGAIAVLSGGSASIIGTDANAIFSGNEAAAKGSAVFVNSGNCSVNVEGYTFTNNTTGTGAVYVVNGGTGVLTDVTFKGANAQIVNVDGTLTFDNVTGTTFVQGQNGKLYVAGYDINNQLSVTPYQYVADHVVFLKADGAVSSVFEAACENITLTPDANDNPWYVNAEGKLTIIAAYIGEMSFGSLAEAVVYANTNGGTGEVADIVITLLNDTILTEKIEITKNIQIVNKVGEEITISRSTDFTTDDMFLVSAGKLTLGTNEASETGKLIVDGATTSAIGFHSVVNASGANFVLAKNASLENANATVAGAAINNSGTAYVYGTIQNNDTSNAGAGIYVNANAIAYTENAVFKGNYAKGGGAAIYVLADGTVTSLNCIFEENEGSSASGNGGAVHAKGNYYDTNSEYKNNIGRNGGAIAVMGTGEVIITGTNEHAIFSGNTAHANGSAIFANSGGCAITVNGYTFTNNTTGTGAVFIQKGGSATFTDITFSGDTAQNVNVNGTLTFDNVTGTTFVQGQNGVLKVAGYVTENELSVTPYQYTEGQVVLLKADETADEVFALASKKIMLVSDGSENTWYMEDGALKIAVARIGDTYYDAWTTAIAYANTVGGTGNAEDVVIYVLTNVALSEKVEITKNIAIVNEAGKEITISRAADFTTADMFLVNADAKLTLGTNDATETGKLIIDGATASRVAYRIVENPSGATFVLAKNATLMNADSSVKGAGLYNNGTAFIYGTIHNNKSSSDGGGINVNAGSVTINGAFFTENYAATTGGLFIAAGASVTCENATFEGNTSPGNGGAVHAKGNYSDTNSKYINNTGKNGGAIAVMSSSAVVTITGTNENAIFSGNQATTAKGGAVFANTNCSATVENYTFVNNTAINPSSDTTEKHAVDGGGTINLVNPNFVTETALFAFANTDLWLGTEEEE